jgi:hypothetical protein
MCKVSVGRTGGASSNALYITREMAVKDKENGLLTRHMEEGIEGQNLAESRTNISSYFWAREEVEINAAPKRRGSKKNIDLSAGEDASKDAGETLVKERKIRTNYRAILSFEREVETDRAKAMVDEWLSHTPFKNAPAIATIHRDTAHPHAHVLIDARRVDGKKVDLSPRQYRTLDEVWNKIYCREFGINEQEYLTKKSETRAYKRAVVEAKQKGEQQPERPARAQFPERDVFDKRDERAGQSIAQDDVLNATQRFDRSLKKVESRIKKQFNLQPASGRQTNVLAELESRIETLRQIEETIRQKGKDLHYANERRAAVREPNAEGRWREFAKEGSGEARVVRPETSATRTEGNADRRGASREGTSGGRDRAFTRTDRSIADIDGHRDIAIEVRESVERETKSGEPNPAFGTSARAGQGGHQSELPLDSRESGKTEPEAGGDSRFAQELTAAAAGEEHHAAGDQRSARSHSLPKANDEPAAGKLQRKGFEREQLDGNGVLEKQSGDVGLLGQDRTRESKDSALSTRSRSIDVQDYSVGVPDRRNVGSVREIGGADEISDFDVNDRSLHSVRLESQALQGIGEGDGAEVGQFVQPVGMGINENDRVLPGINSFDGSELATTALQREFDVLRQASANAISVDDDAALRSQRGMAGVSLRSDLLGADLRERLTASNSSLLDAVGQHVQETSTRMAETVEVIEVESVEIEAAEESLDWLIP